MNSNEIQSNPWKYILRQTNIVLNVEICLGYYFYIYTGAVVLYHAKAGIIVNWEMRED